VTGHWADVPRGQTLGAGTLALDVVEPTQLRKRPAGTTGSFGGSVWKKGGRQLVQQDIQSVESRVQRYDVKLAENNPPCRDFTVMWETVGAVKGPTTPPVRDDYCSFVGDWPGDGDFTFDLAPDFGHMEPTSGRAAGCGDPSRSAPSWSGRTSSCSSCSTGSATFTARPRCMRARTTATTAARRR
jgi:hypothetical protein